MRFAGVSTEAIQTMLSAQRATRRLGHARGCTRTLTRNEFEQASQIRRTDESITKHSFDASGNLSAWSNTDATRPIGHQTASAALTYDNNDCKTGETGQTVTYPTLAGISYSLGYGYSPAQQTSLSLQNSYGQQLELKQAVRSDTAASLTTTLTATYAYDDETRPTQAKVNGDTETFTLDAIANRTQHSRVSGSWVYDANNRLTQRGVQTKYDYDAAGNLVKKTEGSAVTQYRYDSSNRLVEVSAGSTASPLNLVARYGYDPLSRRLWKEQYRNSEGSALTAPTRTYFLYSDEGMIAESQQAITLNADQSTSTTSSPQITTQYGPTPDSLFGTDVLFVRTKNSNGQDTTAYLHRDHLGTPLQATDNTGRIVWAASYNAFGLANITTPSPSADRPTITLNLRLPGQYFDSETGLHQNWYRYYDSGTARYITSDPIGLGGGVNRYAYVGGNPLRYYDSYGLFGMDDVWGGVYWATGGWSPSQGLVDYSAEFGDKLSFGLTDWLRNQMGTNGAVNKCSGYYSAGEWTGVAFDVALGGAVGWEAAGAKGAGKEFSHWIPNRMGGPRSKWNGNYVTPARHYYHDPFRYPRGWRDLGDKYPAWLQQLDRIPNVYKGGAAGGAAGGAGMGANDCGCQQ